MAIQSFEIRFSIFCGSLFSLATGCKSGQFIPQENAPFWCFFKLRTVILGYVLGGSRLCRRIHRAYKRSGNADCGKKVKPIESGNMLAKNSAF